MTNHGINNGRFRMHALAWLKTQLSLKTFSTSFLPLFVEGTFTDIIYSRNYTMHIIFYIPNQRVCKNNHSITNTNITNPRIINVCPKDP